MRPSIVIALGLLLSACLVEAPAKDDCEQARRSFARCGVELPVVQGPTCTGVAKLVARCVVKVGTDCDSLASLTGHLDACVADADGELPPLEDPPLVALDAATADAAADAGAPIDLGLPDAARAPDLALPRWPGLDVSGTLATGSTRSFQAALDPGTYELSLEGSGDVDLYVRIGHAPTTTLYDCRPFLSDSNERCTVTVVATSIVYVLLRADVVDSTYHLIGKED